jgi:hypothetical protein
VARRELRYDVVTDTSKFSRGIDRSSRDLGRLGSAGERTFNQLKTGAKVAGIGLIGGLVVGLKKSADAAIEVEAVQARLQAQLRASNISFHAHADEIDRVITKHSQLSGLDDEDLTDAFTNIVRITGDVDKSLRLTGLAADFARAKHIEVAKAGEIVAKVAGGNTAILNRYGIKIKEGATATEALAELQGKFAGQAEAYGKTTAGSIDRMHVAAENLAETVGTALAPSLATVADKVSKFVTEMQTGEGAGGRFAATLKDIGDRVRPIVSFLKDHPQLIAVAVGAWATYKVASLAALAAIKVSTFRKAFGIGKGAAAAEGAIAGRAYASTFAATSATGVAGAAGKGGKLGRAFSAAGKGLGVLMAASLAYEFRNEIADVAKSMANDLKDAANEALSFLGLAKDKTPGSFRDRVNESIGKQQQARAEARSRRKPSVPRVRNPNEGRGTTARVRTSSVRASASSVLELFHDPAGIPSPQRDHSDHVHVATSSTAERDYLMGVATNQFGLTITSTTGGTHVAGSYHYKGLAFDAAGARMAEFAKWVRDVHSRGGQARSRAASTVGARVRAAPKMTVSTVRRSTAGGARRGFSPGVAPGTVAAFEQVRSELEAQLAFAQIEGGAAQQARVIEAQVRVTQERIRKIQNALKHHLSPAKRKSLTDELAGLLRDIASFSEQITDLTAAPEARPAPSALDLNSRDIARARLTDTTEDDLVELRKREEILRGGLGAAINAGDVAGEEAFLTELRSVLDEIKGLTEAVKDNSALMQQQLDVFKEERDTARREAATSQSQYGVLAKAIADVASGQIGGQIGLGFQSAGVAGQMARY